MSERTKCTCDPHCQMHGIYPPIEPSGTTGPADAGSHETAVTRFEVIDHRNPHGVPGKTCGRVYSAHGCKIELSYQDGGRTLKVFVDAASASAPAVPRETE
jgi:hypothetical protein